MPRIGRWTAVALLSASGCGQPPDPLAIRWDEPEIASAATSRGAAPMFAVGRDGAQVLSWVAEDDTGREVLQVRVTSEAGDTVSAGVLRDSLGGIEPHGEAPPRVAISADGAIYALYTVGREVPGRRFPESTLRLARSDDGGRSWTDPVTVNEGSRFGSHNFHALLAGPDGRVWAAWLSSTRGRSGVWVRRSLDGGRAWEPAVQVDSTEACPCCRTGLALAPDGTLYLSWRAVFPGDIRDVVVARSPDGGATWDPPVRPHEQNWVIAACPHAGPALAVGRQGDVHIAWWTGKPGEAGVHYARSADGGRTWDWRPIATGERSAPAHVQVALGGPDQVFVAWDDGLGPIPRVLLRTSRDAGRRFGPTQAVSEADRAASFPVMAASNGRLVLAWSEASAHHHHEAMASRPDMSNPDATMPLPRVGQTEIIVRQAEVASARGAP